jgi:hypothetical protein
MKCCFCDQNETISHLFLDCQHAKAIWRVVNIAIGLTQPRSINHMMRNWLTGLDNKTKNLIYVRVAALIWAIWCTRNDIIF